METVRIRKPAVAGQFYPGTAEALKKEITSLVDGNALKTDATGCLLPHAGYMYSGYVAAQTVSQINIKDTVILLGPNHTQEGLPYSIMTKGIWQTPLGEVKINSGLAEKIVRFSKYLKDDYLAHAYEHSLEVELPFLQYFKKDFEIIPIAFLSDDLEILKNIGSEIAKVVLDSGLKNSLTLIASSDMTHYESQKDAQEKDKEAIDAILNLDEDKLMERVKRKNISMCGYAPAIVMLKAAKILGAKSARLVKYQTSAEATGDRESVVGYAGIIIS